MKNWFLPKYQRNYFWISAMKFFVASCGLPGSFLGLIINIINKEAYRNLSKASRKKLPATKGRNPEIISLVFWEKLIFHKDIMKSTDLQRQFMHEFYMNFRSEWSHVLKVTSYILTSISDEFENKLGNNRSHKIISIVIKVLDISVFPIDYCLHKLNDCSIHC